MWNELYNENNLPSWNNIREYVKSDLWDKFCTFLEDKYTVTPKIEYSGCSMQKGWNVKYKKSGKSICTLYPMDGYFISLIVIGKKELDDAEELIPSCCEYVKNLYKNTEFSLGGRWLMIEVKSDEILNDVFELIKIRAKKRDKKVSEKVQI